MAFPSQEYYGGLPFPSPGDLPFPGMEPVSPTLAGGLFTTEPPRKPHLWVRQTLILVTRSMEMISMPLFDMLHHFIFPFHPEPYHKGKKLD